MDCKRLVAVLLAVSTFDDALLTQGKTSNKALGLPPSQHSSVTDKTITALKHTEHLLVSAFVDRRSPNFDLRIIGIFKRDSVGPLSCMFWCRGQVLASSSASSSTLRTLGSPTWSQTSCVQGRRTARLSTSHLQQRAAARTVTNTCGLT